MNLALLELTVLDEKEEALWAAGYMRRGRLNYGNGLGRGRGSPRGRAPASGGRGPTSENDSAKREKDSIARALMEPQLWILSSHGSQVPRQLEKYGQS